LSALMGRPPGSRRRLAPSSTPMLGASRVQQACCCPSCCPSRCPCPCCPCCCPPCGVLLAVPILWCVCVAGLRRAAVSSLAARAAAAWRSALPACCHHHAQAVHLAGARAHASCTADRTRAHLGDWGRVRECGCARRRVARRRACPNTRPCMQQPAQPGVVPVISGVERTPACVLRGCVHAAVRVGALLHAAAAVGCSAEHPSACGRTWPSGMVL
jgi:hypothetical protein